MSEQEQPLASARPMVVISVTVGGQQQIYDIQTAQQLIKELQKALKSVATTAPPPAKKKHPTKKRNPRKS